MSTLVTDVAYRAPLSAVQVVCSDEDGSSERWRQWQLRNAAASRKGAMRAHIAFTLVFVGLGVWFALQLLPPSIWR